MNSFHKFCSETSIHGLSHVGPGKPKSLNGLMVFTFALAACGSLLGIFKVVRLYASKPMSTDYRIVANNSMELPSLSVCAMSHLSKTKLRQLNISSELEDAIYFALGFQLKNEHILSNTTMKNEYLQLLREHQLDDFEELLMKISLPCEDMIGEKQNPGTCTMGFRDVNCCTVSKQYLFPAKCVTIAASGFMDPKDAYQYAISLKWPSLSEAFIPSNIAARSRDYTLVMNKGSRGVIGAREIGRARPGRFYTIKVWMRMYESVNNPPWYSCIDELPHPGYDTKECMEDCTLSSVFEGQDSCSCTPAGAFKARRIKTQITNMTGWKELCDPWKLEECKKMIEFEAKILKEARDAKMNGFSPAEKAEYLAMMKEKDNVHERCRQKCPMTCKKTVWNAEMLETIHDPRILEDYYVHRDNGSVSVEHIRKYKLNSSYVVMNFEEMEYKYTKQQLAMTAETVLSYLGGQLGLFLGGSLLTFAHFILFLLYQLCSKTTTEEQTSDDAEEFNDKEEQMNEEQYIDKQKNYSNGSVTNGWFHRRSRPSKSSKNEQNKHDLIPAASNAPPIIINNVPVIEETDNAVWMNNGSTTTAAPPPNKHYSSSSGAILNLVDHRRPRILSQNASSPLIEHSHSDYVMMSVGDNLNRQQNCSPSISVSSCPPKPPTSSNSTSQIAERRYPCVCTCRCNRNRSPLVHHLAK